MLETEVAEGAVQSPPPREVSLEVKDLTKKYGDFTAVDQLSFSLNKGDVLGFLGPNGAGKTTTMRILTTFLPPTGGTAEILGKDILADADAVRRIIGYMPENPPIYEEMTVTGYLRFVGTIRQVPRRALKEAVERTIERVQLQEKAKSLLGTLSKGFRQRVGLAQAILHDPQVLILDEPTAGLDPHQVREIRGLISELAQEHTILLSTHILSEVISTCTRVLILNRGSKVYDESIQEGSGDLEELFIRLTLGREESESTEGGAA